MNAKILIPALALATVSSLALAFVLSENSHSTTSINADSISLSTPDEDLGQLAMSELEADEELLALADELEMEHGDLEAELLGLEGEITDSSFGAWEVQPNNNPTLEVEEKIVDKTAIKLNQKATADVAVGDQVSFNLTDSDVTATVNRIIHTENGLQWQGYLEGYGDQYPVLYTQSSSSSSSNNSSSSFATITSPNGLYSLETIDGEGWVYKTPSLASLVDPNAPDHLAPEHSSPNHQHDQQPHIH